MFVDKDYESDCRLGGSLAHELGHMATNSTKEEDAERVAREYRNRLKGAHVPMCVEFSSSMGLSMTSPRLTTKFTK